MTLNSCVYVYQCADSSCADSAVVGVLFCIILTHSCTCLHFVPGWLETFVKAEFPNAAKSRAHLLLEKNHVERAMRAYTKAHTGDMRPEDYRAENLPRLHKKRRGKPGRCRMAEYVEDEVFDFFINTVLNVKGRVPSALLLAEAECIAQDYLADWRRRVDLGELEPECEPVMPKFDKHWIKRWRQRYGITWRTVNLRMKCSKGKLYARLQVFWCNVLKVRFLHFFLNGKKQILRFENCDQKPFWYTTADGCKTLAIKGVKKISVRENVPLTRKRFTCMTRCTWPRPRHRQDKKLCAVMLKGVGTKLREQVPVPEDVLLQFAPKASYRIDTTIEFYKWLVQPSTGPEDETVYLSDWYAPNIANADLNDVFIVNGHGHLNIPGCATGHVQVPDTHEHLSLSSNYKTREIHDAMCQLRAGAKLPVADHSKVTDRCIAAVRDVNHERVSQGFVEVGIANNLDGSQDFRLTSDVMPIWQEVKMSEKREEIRKEMETGVENGTYTSFLDCMQPGFFKAYPDEPEPEGSESFKYAAADNGESDNESVSTPVDHDGDADIFDDDEDDEPFGLLEDMPAKLMGIASKVKGIVDPPHATGSASTSASSGVAGFSGGASPSAPGSANTAASSGVNEVSAGAYQSAPASSSAPESAAASSGDALDSNAEYPPSVDELMKLFDGPDAESVAPNTAGSLVEAPGQDALPPLTDAATSGDDTGMLLYVMY